jgi:5'-methylthioadenosine phosphorylase
MRVAIIGGTGFDQLEGLVFSPETIRTPYGEALVFRGQGDGEDLIFLARHGPQHSVPPHKINYRANMKALQMLGVDRVLATFAVGSLVRDIPPMGLAAVDQFLDFTHGREWTYYDGGASGLAHSEMTEPYCPALRERLLALAPAHGLKIRPAATYVCTNGPRLETAAEVRMYAQLGGHVVGMTGVPEAPLARELGLHYAAVAYSINWAAGLSGTTIQFEEAGISELQKKLVDLYVDVLRSPLVLACVCTVPVNVIHPPQESAK